MLIKTKQNSMRGNVYIRHLSLNHGSSDISPFFRSKCRSNKIIDVPDATDIYFTDHIFALNTMIHKYLRKKLGRLSIDVNSSGLSREKCKFNNHLYYYSFANWICKY